MKNSEFISPSSQHIILRILILFLLSAALGWSMIIHMDMPVLPFDDAFITFRYVHNLLDGKGLVYNQGQRIFGSTSPLYLFWLTVLKIIFPDWAIPSLAVRFNAIPFGTAGLVLFLLIKKYTRSIPVALLGSLSFLSNPFLLSISGGGMESFLYVTLVLLALLCLAHKKPIRINGWMTSWVTGFEPKNYLLVPTSLTWGLLIVASAVLLIMNRRNSRFGWQGMMLFWIILLFYGIGNPLFFSWYWPNVFVFALVVLLSGFYLLRFLGVTSSKKVGHWVGWLIWMVGGCWVIYASLMPNLIPIKGGNAPTLFIISDLERWRIISYEQSAKILNREALPSDTVAAAEVGALGFFLKGFIYDACGLVSPEALPFLPVPDDQCLGPDIGAISTAFIKEVKPDWVVTMPIFL